MESQSAHRPEVQPHPDDIRRAKELVRPYDGDQTDRPCIDVLGYFLVPESGDRRLTIDGLRRALAKVLSSNR